MLAAAANALFPFFLIPDIPGRFRFGGLTLVGQLGIATSLLATIAVLYGIEPSLRNSHGSTRWRLKYLALGLGAIFAVRFYLLSQVLLFHLLDRQSLLIGAMSLLIGELVLAVGFLRSGALRTDLTVSRHFVYRSIVVGLCGLYLFLAGVAGWLLNALGIPEAALLGTLVVFVAVLGLWHAVSQPGDPWASILLGTLGGALALLGPGAWSVDARLFGWKRIDPRGRRP